MTSTSATTTTSTTTTRSTSESFEHLLWLSAHEFGTVATRDTSAPITSTEVGKPPRLLPMTLNPCQSIMNFDHHLHTHLLFRSVMHMMYYVLRTLRSCCH